MAGASLLILIDDIASLLDDVAAMTKVAAKKTAGVLSDDLALNAEQVSGVRANRELPVVWSVAKGSALNKLLLIPCALLIDHFFPWLIVALLIIGGAYLCFEGAEKLLHTYQQRKLRQQAPTIKKQAANIPVMSEEEIAAMEKTKIRGAIRTDFILSAEIIVIALNVVKGESLLVQASTLLVVATLITVGVYGLVAAIVKLDDIGYWMVRRSRERNKGKSDGKDWQQSVGLMLVNAMPHLMKFLSIVGTIAMFLVGGGIIAHNIGTLHQMELNVVDWITQTPAVGEMLGAITPTVLGFVVGLIVGWSVLIIVKGVQSLLGKKA